jgi:hypothetical protein
VPIIEYTLELLVTAGVKELFVVCSTHAEKIQDYCADSPACRQFAVHVLNVPGCKSMGEAMREVYSRGNIRGDFILVSGDVVSNIKLEPALKAHKRRREEEKNKDAVRAPPARPPASSLRSLLLAPAPSFDGPPRPPGHRTDRALRPEEGARSADPDNGVQDFSAGPAPRALRRGTPLPMPPARPARRRPAGPPVRARRAVRCGSTLPNHPSCNPFWLRYFWQKLAR